MLKKNKTMKIVYCGAESSGKSLLLAKKSIEILERNKKWFKMYGFKRKVLSNLIFSDEIFIKYKDYIEYWDDVHLIVGRLGVDIIFDEISNEFSATRAGSLTKRVNQWLRQGAKQGVHFYATAQEFNNINIDFRRRVNKAFHIKKLFGSERGGQDLPPIKKIWGWCMVREFNVFPYDELRPKYISIIPKIIKITPKLCSVFDTYQPISPSDIIEVSHFIKHCKVCGMRKVVHR